MGVTAASDVDYGRIYGPFPAVGHVPRTHFIGYLTADQRQESGTVKINLNDSYLGTSWLPYVQPARTVDEQNMEAYTKDGNIFYRTLRIIRADEELFVWYSKDFAQILGIPHTSLAHTADDEKLRCSGCGEQFKYLYSLLAHSRFKCSKLDNQPSPAPSESGDVNEIALTPEDINRLSAEPGKLKRKHEFSNDIPNKRSAHGETREENNNDKESNYSQRVNKELKDVVVGSAFRKVEKTHINRTSDDDKAYLSTVEKSVESEPCTTTNTSALPAGIVRHMFNPTATGRMGAGISAGLGMLMSSWVVPTSGTHTYVDPRLYTNSSIGSTPDKRSNLPGRMMVSVPESVRRLPGGDMMSKQLIMEQLRKSQLPCIQSANPMVEKILQTTVTPAMLQRPIQPLNLAQNWCAKCNATFRMTSDLVYHMRSHHKREFDPIKKKRDDKLQCDVCKETFKERHHLTRHMTSHT